MSPKRFEEAEEQPTKANEYGSHRLTVLQVQRCPWCGTPITAAQVKADATARRVFVYCGDDPRAARSQRVDMSARGLPILTVDEEIYRLTPAFVIATVDKFARPGPRRRKPPHCSATPDGAAVATATFIPTTRLCNIATAHPAVAGYPAATVHLVNRLRPPT